MIYRTDTHRPTEKTSVTTGTADKNLTADVEQFATDEERSRAIKQAVNRELFEGLIDVVIACASVALFLAGVAALLYVLHVLWGMA